MKMLALSLGLTAALIWAVHDLLARKLSQGAALLPIILVVLGAGSVALIGPAMVWGDWAGLSGGAVRLSLAAGLAVALAIGTLYRAFSIAPARIVSPIIGSYPILSLALAAAQGRGVTAWDWMSVVAVVLGIAVVSMTAPDGEAAAKAPVGQAMGWSALSACGFAATFAIGQEAARQGSELPTILITRIMAFVVIGGLFVFYRGRIAGLRGNWRLICAMGAMDALALGLVTASGNLPLSEYASVASSLFGVGTILLASIFLGEKLRAVQWGGVALVFAGIGFLSAQG